MEVSSQRGRKLKEYEHSITCEAQMHKSVIKFGWDVERELKS